MGVKYDWLQRENEGLGSQGYRGRSGETLVKHFSAVRVVKGDEQRPFSGVNATVPLVIVYMWFSDR